MAQESVNCHIAAILLGGHSSRMGGVPKFMLEDSTGQSYLKKQIEMLGKFDKIYLSAANEQQLELIQNVSKENCQGLIDMVKDCGPLGGLYTVLQQLKAKDEWVFVTACDVPDLTESMVDGLIQLSAYAYSSEYDCIVYQDSHGRMHPLCGLYRRSLLLVIQKMLQYNDYKMMNLLIRSRCLVVQAAEMGISDKFFVNINTPGDYQRWKKKQSQKEQKILCVCGVKNSGKTTYIEKLIAGLTAEGRRVAVIKHDGHDFEGDRLGTDTYRFHKAGAEGTAIFSKNRYMINADKTVDWLQLKEQFSDADIILVEGLKQSALPKIEIVREGISDELSCSRENLIAVVTDVEKDFGGFPRWPLNEWKCCVEYLLD